MALYDPNHRFTPAPAETKTFDPEAFYRFVAGKPADDEYGPAHITACALGQFGFVGSLNSLSPKGVPQDIYSAAASYDCDRPGVYGHVSTFGGLREKLEALGYGKAA